MAAFPEWATRSGAALAGLFFPEFCRLCGTPLRTRENGYFCPACWEASPRVERPYCYGCARPHPPAAGFASRENFLCADCREAKRPHRFCIAAVWYDGALAEAVKLLKFRGKQRLAAPLGELLAEAIQRELPVEQYAYAVPVPLHRVRQRERGFNQSTLLARTLAAQVATITVDERLVRIRPTRVQSRLNDHAERRANVRGAFAWQGPDLHGENILLIDDVVTTGGTVQECARALRRAGAGTIDIAAVAVAAPLPTA